MCSDLTAEVVSKAMYRAVERYVRMTNGQDVQDDPCERILQVFIAEQLSARQPHGRRAAATCEWSVARLVHWTSRNTPYSGAVDLGSSRVDVAYFPDGVDASDIIEVKPHEWIFPDLDKLERITSYLQTLSIPMRGFAVGCKTHSDSGLSFFSDWRDRGAKIFTYDLTERIHPDQPLKKTKVSVFVAEVP